MTSSHHSLDVKLKLEELKEQSDILKSEKHILAEKLDAAYRVYVLSNELLKQQLPDSDQISQYKQKAESQLKLILNVQDVKLFHSLMKEREIKKIHDIEYIPSVAPKLSGLSDPRHAITKNAYLFRRLAGLKLAYKDAKVMPVTEDSRLEDSKFGIESYGPVERAPLRVHIADHKFHTVTGELCNTRNNQSHEKDEYASYVINPQGELSLFSHLEDGNIFHATLNAQASVFGAGEIKIVDGELKALTVYSGHYKPTEENVYQVLKYFRQHGIDISNTVVYFFNELIGDKKQIEEKDFPAADKLNALEYCYPAIVIYNAGIARHVDTFKEALDRKDLNRVREFVELMRNNPDDVLENKMPPLLWAVRNDDVPTVRYLLSKGANPDLKSNDSLDNAAVSQSNEAKLIIDRASQMRTAIGISYDKWPGSLNMAYAKGVDAKTETEFKVELNKFQKYEAARQEIQRKIQTPVRNQGAGWGATDNSDDSPNEIPNPPITSSKPSSRS